MLVEKAISPECLPRSDIRVDSVGCRGFRRQMTARIEDAYHARNAGISASAAGRTPAAIVCQTLDEFIVNSAGRDPLAA